MNGHEKIRSLIKELSELEESLAWYQRTYEYRSLAGVLKDKLTSSRKGGRWARKKLPGNSLEEQIINFIDINPFTVRSIQTNVSVSIIMLSFNRIEDTKASIERIQKYTKVPFELIILDNNSDKKVKEELKQIIKKYSNVRLVLENVNLGCAKGRTKAARFAKYEYLLFLDNDIMVMPHYMEGLVAEVLKSDDVAAACCKVVFPDGLIQFNGGSMVIDDGYALYSLRDERKAFDDVETNHHYECEWIPGGATLWRKEVFDRFGIDDEMRGSFEDNEVSYRIKRAGLRLVNAPSSIVLHDHFDFKNSKFQQAEAQYFEGRNNKERILSALLRFYSQHGLIFSFAWKNNPWDILWGLDSKESIQKFIRENLPPPCEY